MVFVHPSSVEAPLHDVGRIAVMQPYLFPYVGYYQLAAAVDLLVVLDDVTYIKQGWINRNKLLLNQVPTWFTIPLKGAGSHVRICDAQVDRHRYGHWHRKFMRSLVQHYRGAPHFKDAHALVATILPSILDESDTISEISSKSISEVMSYVGAPVRMRASSTLSLSPGKRSAARVIDICKHFGATSYVNLPGGVRLYDEAQFRAEGLSLSFIQPGERSLNLTAAHGCALSIVHALMHHGPAEIRAMLDDRGLHGSRMGVSCAC